MTTAGLFILVILAFISAVISTLFGVAGGFLLFTALSLILSPKEAIVIHAIVQLINNLLRSSVMYRHISWHTVAYFSFLVVPGAFLGGKIFNLVSNDWLELAIGLGILTINHLPKLRIKKRYGLLTMFIGFNSSFLGMLIGVTGPIVTTYLAALRLSKEPLIATKSMCQTTTQFAKLLIFWQLPAIHLSDHYFLISIILLTSTLSIYVARKLMKIMTSSLHRKLVIYLLDGAAILMIISSLKDL